MLIGYAQAQLNQMDLFPVAYFQRQWDVENAEQKKENNDDDK